MNDEQIKKLGHQAALAGREMLGTYLTAQGQMPDKETMKRDASYKWATAINKWVVMKLCVSWQGGRIGTVLVRRNNGKYQLRVVMAKDG